MDLQQVVGAHQPHEPVPALDVRQSAQRVGGILRAELRFGVGNVNTRVRRRDLLGGVQPALVARHAVRVLERVLRRNQPPHLVQRQQLQGLLTYI
jgi:hypothetical protein